MTSSVLDPEAEPSLLALTPLRRRVITLALMCGTFLASLDVTVVGTAMPAIAGELGGLPLYGWVFSVYLLTSTVTVPIYGKLADVWGRRPAYLLGGSIFLLGSVACGMSTSMLWLIAARGLQGLGAGAMIPVTLVAIGDMYPAAARARVMSVFSLVWGMSSVAGPTAGGLLVGFGWPWVFLVNVPIGGVALLAVALTMRDPPPVRGARIDVAGALSCMFATTAVLLGANELREGQTTRGAVLLAIGFVLAAWFVRVERRAPDPILPPALLANRTLAVSAGAGLALGGALFGTIAYVPLWMRAVMGKSIVASGAALIPLSLAWTTGAFVAGKLITRFGFRTPVVAGGTLVGIGTLGMAIAAEASSPTLVIVSSGALGAGLGLSVTSTNVAAQEQVGFRMRGAATALLQFARTMGGTLVVSVLGLVLALEVTRGLEGIAGAPDASDLVDPDRLLGVPDAALVPARAALARALGHVFSGIALAGAVVFAIKLGFPRSPMDDDRRPTRG